MNPLIRKITGLAAGLALATASVIALSPAASAAVTYPVSAGVNVRSGPGTSYSVVAVVSGSQSFNCYLNGTSINGDTVWGHLSNGLGYISDWYILAGGKTLAQLGVPLCGTTPATLTYPVSAGVNVRNGPGTNYNVVGVVSGSQTFNCYAIGTSINGDTVWGHLNNGLGYISDWYIQAGGKTLAQLGLQACGPIINPVPNVVPATVQGKINMAVGWAIAIANDNSHGYSLTYRQGPDYDCSSFVSNAYAQAGTGVNKNDWTGSMLADYKAHGFTAYPFWMFDLANLRQGDVLLNQASHTEMVYTNVSGKITMVAAHSDYGYPQTGDQTGKEINTSPYWYDNWEYVLRYTG